MFVGPYIALSNPSFFLETESSLHSGPYIARNLAVGIAFLIAIYLKNASMLFILIVVKDLKEFLVPGFINIMFQIELDLSQLINLIKLSFVAKLLNI